jgi:hypothetical protein
MGIFTKYGEFKMKRELKKREKQFSRTKEYVSNSIEDIEVYNNE